MMTADDLTALRLQLTANEGRRAYLYDDATGKRITKGSVVVGHPTIGIGCNLDAGPLSDAAIDAEFEARLESVVNSIGEALPWALGLRAGPFRVLCDIAYNGGMDGLVGFHRMLAYLHAGDLTNAGKELINSQLAPARAARLAALLRT